MSEWWTYRPSDFLLFSTRSWYRLFELYNADIWPAQLLALALGAIVLLLAFRGRPPADRAIAAIMAACWLWTAWAFHLERYATINWAAAWFAAAFVVQALLMLWTGTIRGRLAFRPGWHPRQLTGLSLFVFALLVQPVLGPLLGRPWSQVQAFGVTPDPTVVATLGLLLLDSGKASARLRAIPLLWCAAGALTLWAMGSPDALVMLVAGLGAWVVGCYSAHAASNSARAR
ncbi:MAG: MFS transporter permease [Burkholderiales bacterium]|nr:MAG: MFS transporter permease [Burkholderiales bacterium]